MLTVYWGLTISEGESMTIMVGSVAMGWQAWGWSSSWELTPLSITSKKQRELTRNGWAFENKSHL